MGRLNQDAQKIKEALDCYGIKRSQVRVRTYRRKDGSGSDTYVFVKEGALDAVADVAGKLVFHRINVDIVRMPECEHVFSVCLTCVPYYVGGMGTVREGYMKAEKADTCDTCAQQARDADESVEAEPAAEAEESKGEIPAAEPEKKKKGTKMAIPAEVKKIKDVLQKFDIKRSMSKSVAVDKGGHKVHGVEIGEEGFFNKVSDNARLLAREGVHVEIIRYHCRHPQKAIVTLADGEGAVNRVFLDEICGKDACKVLAKPAQKAEPTRQVITDDELAEWASSPSAGEANSVEFLSGLTPEQRYEAVREARAIMRTTPGFNFSGAVWQAVQNLKSGNLWAREKVEALRRYDPTGEKAAAAAKSGKGWEGFLADAMDAQLTIKDALEETPVEAVPEPVEAEETDARTTAEIAAEHGLTEGKHRYSGRTYVVAKLGSYHVYRLDGHSPTAVGIIQPHVCTSACHAPVAPHDGRSRLRLCDTQGDPIGPCVANLATALRVFASLG